MKSGGTKRILFATIGSLGDLHPCLGLALELKRRGHTVAIAATPFYRAKVEELGLAFKPLRPDWDPTCSELVSQCQNIRRGPEILIRKLVLPHLGKTYADLLEAAREADLMVAGELVYAAPLVAEKLELRWASAILSPCTFFSAHDPSVLVTAPELMILRKAGVGVNRAILAMSRWATRRWWSEVKQLRRREGLSPGGNPLLEDKFSPDLVLALFSPALAEAQPDWPSQTLQPGFVFFDKAHQRHQSLDAVEAFIAEAEAPLVFTQGSTAVHDPGQFYEISLEAARKLGRRALLLGAKHSRSLTGSDVLVAPYAPYSEIFPRGCVVVHQGGSGTTGMALRARRPMLVVPYGWDQPDNGARIQRSGAGLCIARRRYTVSTATAALRRLIEDRSFAHRAAMLGEQISAEAGTLGACDALEAMLAK